MSKESCGIIRHERGILCCLQLCQDDVKLIERLLKRVAACLLWCPYADICLCMLLVVKSVYCMTKHITWWTSRSTYSAFCILPAVALRTCLKPKYQSSYMHHPAPSYTTCIPSLQLHDPAALTVHTEQHMSLGNPSSPVNHLLNHCGGTATLKWSCLPNLICLQLYLSGKWAYDLKAISILSAQSFRARKHESLQDTPLEVICDSKMAAALVLSEISQQGERKRTVT